ncbi:MAG: PDZ domain-containing protein [Bryobacteraceae bacterium]
MVSGPHDSFEIIVAAKAAGSAGEVPVMTGDVIRQLNGQPITMLDRLRETLKALSPGAPVVLQIQRDSRLQFLAFTLE